MMMSYSMLSVKQVVTRKRQRNIYGIAWARFILEELREEQCLSYLFFFSRRTKQKVVYYFIMKLVISQETIWIIQDKTLYSL